MSFQIDPAIGLITGVENNVNNAMRNLNSSSSVAEITRAGFLSGVFQMIVTAVTQVIKTDAEAKKQAAQAMGR